jgi:hypothetical protein
MTEGRFLDWWSVPHFVGFALLYGWGTWAVGPWPAWMPAVSAFGVGIVWEVVEYMRETARSQPVREPWTNRWIGDPLVDVAGALAGWAVATWGMR